LCFYGTICRKIKEGSRTISLRGSIFSTNCDYKVGKILANDKIESYLMFKLDKLENKEFASPLNSVYPKGKLTWTGNKTDLIELIYALVEAKVFNNGKSTLKSVVAYFENVF